MTASAAIRAARRRARCSWFRFIGGVLTRSRPRSSSGADRTPRVLIDTPVTVPLNNGTFNRLVSSRVIGVTTGRGAAPSPVGLGPRRHTGLRRARHSGDIYGYGGEENRRAA